MLAIVRTLSLLVVVTAGCQKHSQPAAAAPASRPASSATAAASAPDAALGLSFKTGASEANLSGMGLTHVPDVLRGMTALQTVDLTKNNIREIPDWLLALPHLTDLRVAENDLPYEEVERLEAYSAAHNNSPRIEATYAYNVRDALATKAPVFRINDSDAHTLPAELFRLTELRSLEAHGLDDLPAAIGSLKHLTTLDVSHGKIRALPPSLFGLTELDTLVLWDNPITTLPPAIAQLGKLTHLDLAEDALAGLPPEIGQLATLVSLDLSFDPLITLPPEIGGLAALTELWLDGTELSTLPPELGKLAALVRLGAAGARLTTLPDTLGDLAHLEMLDVDDDPLAALPPKILASKSIQWLAAPDELSKTKGVLHAWKGSGNNPYAVVSIDSAAAEDVTAFTRSIMIRDATSWHDALDGMFVDRRHLRSVALIGGDCFGQDGPEDACVFMNDIEGLHLPSGVQTVDLSTNKLKKIPQGVLELPHLRRLKLGSNLIDDIPPGLAKRGVTVEK
jgi:Leucine-rich repeat (LRR) protein